MENDKYDNIYDKTSKAMLSGLPRSGRIAEFLQARFGLEVIRTEEVPYDIQKVIERKPDFLIKCIGKDEQEFMLHIEYQTSADSNMLHRMLVYRALIGDKFNLPVFQLVIYFGQDSYPMDQTQIDEPDLQFGFSVWEVRNTPYQELIQSAHYGEVVLAIISNHAEGELGGQSQEEIVHKIIERIKQLATGPETFNRYMEHLLIFSKIKKLDNIVLNIIKNMENVDLKDFALYQEVKAERDKELAIRQIKRGLLPDEAIAEYFELTLEDIQQLRQELKDKGEISWNRVSMPPVAFGSEGERPDWKTIKY